MLKRFRRAEVGADDAERYRFPVQVGRVTLKNPVIASSGTYGYGLEYQRFGDPSLLGALVVKSLTDVPRRGHPAPRVTPLDEPGSMLNAIGVPNPGVAYWAEHTLPKMLAAHAPVVASIWGTDADAVVRAAELLADHEGPIAWEVNLSCPNADHPGRPVAHDAAAAAVVCREVRRLAPASAGVWVKLAPDAPDLVEVAAACHEAGVDAVTVSNTMPAGSQTEPTPTNLGGGPGGISGPRLGYFVRPLVDKLCASRPDIPVLACGGVVSSAVALDYLRLGATAVQVGTASLYDPRACHKIARGVVSALRAEAPASVRSGADEVLA